MSAPSVHDDWLSLIEISGPFLAVPVLKESFPQGLEELDATKRKRLRQAYEEWREALELEDAQFAELHVAWIDEVLSRGLELNEDGKGDVLKRADWCAANLQATLPEHGVTLSPDLAVVDEQRANKPLLLIQTYAQDVDLDATQKLDGWAATPADRMVQLCRSLGCRLGLVTNGERWMLVDTPVGAVTTFASWYARIWSQEPITLQAFVHLLGIRRFFVDETEQLPALFDRSLKFQDEVTDALGEQVRRAVEVLIQTLDKADQDRNRELLHDVKEPELYEAALTVMMRLVFLLSAEERGLLLMGDERYEANYALSTLRMQLRKESEEILERRWDAWSRLLAIFRAVFGGIEHENLRLPALGGSLFDPDRFPFLEGRAKGSNWRSDAAKPLPIDNRTVLLLLEAIQQFQGRTLSYRALDVEQIGYVYEGLLERTVKRTDEVTLELDATKSAKIPWVKLAELDSARLDGIAQLAELLQERSGSSASRVRNDQAKPVDDTLADRLLTACQGDTKLRDRVKPYAHLLRTDPWGYPLVYPAGAFIVTTGSDRRETGTHYTPKSLTEAIVTETLTPVAYVGPAEGTPRAQWVLKSPAELLDLKICDPAMGSGAFLVQACRWLSDRLVEAWSQVEAMGKTVSVDGEVLEAGATKEPLPRDSEARTVIARRLIAERCLYGVDLNPLAVELAKLSIWLVTLAKGRPFGFLDHNLRCGDSLLGIHRLDQLTELSMTPGRKGERTGNLFGQNIEKAVLDAIELRQRLREMPIRDIHDIEAMARLDAESRRCLEVPERIADAFIGEVLASGGNASALENGLASLVILAGQAAEGILNALDSINRNAVIKLSADLPIERSGRKPFHWPLEFPEVYVRTNSGFNAFVGNPPFLRGHDISGTTGQRYREYIATYIVGGSSGIADLCAYFVRRVSNLVRAESCSGFIATNSISEGDSKSISLAYLIENKFHVISADPNLAWPGKASVVVSPFVVFNGEWRGACRLHGEECDSINSSLSTIHGLSTNPLQENTAKAFVGCYVLGNGFEFSPDLAAQLIAANERNRDVLLPYLNGIELNGFPSASPKRMIACFWDWSLEKASTYSEVFDAIKHNFSANQDKDKWWLYARSRPDLYHRIGLGERFSKHPKGWVLGGHSLSSVIVKAKTSNTWGFEIYPTHVIFDQAITVIASDHLGLFATLQSTIHEIWARYSGAGSAMKTDLRYAPTLFETFPFPSSLAELSDIGRRYHQKRSEIMRSLSIGLTKLYNGFHDPDNITCVGVDVLRNLHKELDIAIVHSYGWTDIDLKHAFYDVHDLPENDRVRFTISDTARTEVLRRLSELNRQRHEEEAASGQHSGSALRTSFRAKRGSRVAITESVQPAFDFDTDTPTNLDANGSVGEVLDFLRSNGSWFAKADILAATNISDGNWKPVIEGLIASGKVERQGEKRGARYRAIDIEGAAQ